MNSLKRYGFLAIILSLGLSFHGCAKKKDVSSAADAANGAASDASSMTEENLDDYSDIKLTMAEAEQVLSNTTTIYFGYDQSSLSGENLNKLKRVAAALRMINSTQISIQGHCDERGSNEYNLALGDQRARSVQDYLENLGVSSNQLDTTSFGEERPAMMGSNESAWTQNRRAELVRR